jgi:hypothetical protein
VAPSPTTSASTPPIDTDGDGVPDVIDECPTVPAGDFPDPLHPGCPLPPPSPSASDPSPSP